MRTGTAIALNGDQDSEIKREAAVFWKEMDMRTAVNAAVADAKRRCENGEIPWTYAAIKKEITPYPNRNCLDVFLLVQEDEPQRVQALKAMRAARSKIFAQKIGWMEPTLMCHSRRSTIRMQNTMVTVPRLWQS